jgi:hypothetical protein
LGEPLDDPLLLFSVLYGIWVANFAAFNGSAVQELGAQFFALAEKQKTTAPLMLGHRIMGFSLLCTGNLVEGRAHFNHALALYVAAEHRLLATRFGQDVAVATLSYRSTALWMLGYPVAALADAEKAVMKAREIGQAATLMYALANACFTTAFRGDYAKAAVLVDEVVPLAEEKDTSYWKGFAMMIRGWLLTLAGKRRTQPRCSRRRSLYSDPVDQPIGCRNSSHTWRWHTRNWASSMMLGAASAKQ